MFALAPRSGERVRERGYAFQSPGDLARWRR